MRNIIYKALPQSTYTPGVAPVVEMIRGVKTHALIFEVTADVTIVGAAGGNVLAEGIQRLIERVRVLENGRPVADLSGRHLAYITGRAQYQAASIDALANANAQANTILRALLCIPFADPWGADPTETCYVPTDSRFPVNIEFTYAASPEAALISGTGLTLNSLTVRPTQVYDPTSTVMPFFIPRYRRVSSQAIVGTSDNFPIYLYPEAGHRLAFLVANALQDGASTATVFDGNVTLRGDKNRYVDTIPFRTITNELRRKTTGATPSAAYLDLDSRPYGKLSEMYIVGQDDNLRLEADVTNGGTTCFADVLLVEMEAIPGYTRDLPVGW